MKKLIFLLVFLIPGTYALNAQENDVTGSWLGSISIGSVQFRIVFNITENDEGILAATMDSPDQGAKDIPTGKVSCTEDSLVIMAPGLMGEYRGKLVMKDSITGTWSQAGRTYNLNLKRLEEAFSLNRPQEPEPPYPYMEENVSFKSEAGDFMMGGTLTIPEGEEPFPGVILISGSGSQNRDEEIFGHKPFKVLADHLSSNGIAVLRYDDRGIGQSAGNPLGATSADFAKDAYGAFKYLADRKETDNEKLGIIGHSEGGLIAFMMADSNKEIDFIISMAGPGTKGSTVLEDQSQHISRLNNVSEEVIKQNEEINGNIYRIMEKEENPTAGVNEINLFLREYLEKQGEAEEVVEQVMANIHNTVNPSTYPWLRFFSMSDPNDYFPGIKCPVLAINGGKDCQVMAEKNIDAITKGIMANGNENVTGMVFPELNHMFQHSDTGLVDEYGDIEETMSPEVLETILQWIKKKLK